MSEEYMPLGRIVSTTSIKVMESADNRSWNELRAAKEKSRFVNRFVFVFLGMHEGESLITPGEAERRMNEMGWRRMTQRECEEWNAKQELESGSLRD